ncbi:MAG: endolytic transglycosylase MltG, partial [Oscillospiraceae bacterium]|nr:endolytic transglycosylase MltG [Oscillospiraceae bacterium]
MISKSENALGEISIDQPVQTEPKKTSGNSSGNKKLNSGKKKKKRKQKKHGSIRIYGVLIMLTLVFVISISLAIGIIEIGKDMLGINGSQKLVLFTIPEGATTAEIAEDLYEDGIIKIPKAFIYFSRLSKADASYVAGNHEISASMAYETLIDELKKSPDVVEEQAVVDVMFPEGISLYDAAQKLE